MAFLRSQYKPGLMALWGGSVDSVLTPIGEAPQHARAMRVAPTVATILVIGLCVAAGNWQRSRLHDKEALRAQFEQGEAAAPLHADQLPGEDAHWGALRYRPVELAGRFDADHQILLDNKVEAGRIGYHAVAPFRLADGRMVLVDRGWVPQGRSRADVPAAPPPAGAVTLRGWINWPARGYLELRPEVTAGAVWQHVDLPRFAAATGLRPLPIVIEQAAPAVAGDDLLRVFPAPDFGIDTHRIYMVQWYAFAGLAGIFWLITHWPRRVRKPRGEVRG